MIALYVLLGAILFSNLVIIVCLFSCFQTPDFSKEDREVRSMNDKILNAEKHLPPTELKNERKICQYPEIN